MRTWVVGDSIVARAGEHNPPLLGAGEVIWCGLSGAKCINVVHRLTELLRRKPFPTTVILHLGTNDIFRDPTWKIRKRVYENLKGVRNLLPNTRLIWSDILLRLEYSEQIHDGAGKRNMRNINKKAHKVCREKLGGNNKIIVHSGLFQSGRRRVQDRPIYVYDCTHPSNWGLRLLRQNWSDALVYFNQNPQAVDFPPGSIRLQD